MCEINKERRRFLGQTSAALTVGGMGLLADSKAEAQFYPVMCSWAGAGQVGAGLGPASPQAQQKVAAIMRAIQFNAPLRVFSGGVPNASASVIGGALAVIYNPHFLGNLARCDRVAALSVLAHEVGHHANQDTTWMGQFKHSWQRELGADYVSGIAMRRLGIPHQRALNGILCSFGPFSPGSQSHPDSQNRLRAVSAGWYA